MNLLRYNFFFDINQFKNDNVPRQKCFVPYDPFEELSNEKFIKIYRLKKERVANIIDIVRQNQPIHTHRSALDIPRQVLTALAFFATGSYQTDISLSKYSLMKLFNFPGIGCIDCTHIAIYPPPLLHAEYPEHVFVNRKGYHSLNVQLICDADFKIVNVNAKFPGSTHDSFIWNNSNIEPLMRQIHNNYNGKYMLLGDSGYPLRPWLMTPFIDPPSQSPQEAFNTAFCKARSMIERVNGILKMRFRCLLKHRILHYSPPTAAKIINTCVVLHNMAIIDGVDDAEADQVWLDNNAFGIIDEPATNLNQPLGRVDPDLAAGRLLQQQIVSQTIILQSVCSAACVINDNVFNIIVE
ncbi:hypothetical protein HCN44_003380 [Aphidius gifuensis]|uniref:DDE Tnp4 domain-containing protein n=1 Tax=Aphidius gifuensis TaxID=684658 RepID=A0A834XVR4_APHGI|nr:hypothetical protein HCN44_003380 [Aphidius gifuensis]